MNKRLIASIAGVGATVALMAGLSISGGTGSAAGSSVRIHQASADYPIFADVAALDPASTAVVRGEVVSVGDAYRVIPKGLPIEKLPPQKAAQVGVVQADVTFRVAATLSGTNLTDTTITVSQLGGQIGNDKVVVEDEPSAEKGKSYVLFLRRFDNGKYGVVGGPQGRYAVSGGKLVNLGDHAKGEGVGKQLNGLALVDFEKSYRSLASTATAKAEPGRQETQEPLNPSSAPPKQ